MSYLTLVYLLFVVSISTNVVRTGATTLRRANAVPVFDLDFQYDGNEDNYKNLPKRSELPVIPEAPAGAAWFWGRDDGLGRLNFQTAKRVKETVKNHVKSGEFASLNAPVYTYANPPFYQRAPIQREFLPFNGSDVPIYDERLELNTQTSSQLDGFRHFGHLQANVFYNNCTQSDIVGPNPTSRCGIQFWGQKGIAGRGILIDVGRYAVQKHNPIPILTPHNITLSYLKEVAQSQGIDLRRKSEGGDVKIGDILLVRTGFYEAYTKLTDAERIEITQPTSGWIGLQASEDMADFLHDSYFSAVVADNPSLEAWPLPLGSFSLHEKMLPLWGLPIGEMWDLEALAAQCERNQRWKFLVTSAPFNLEGGIASWANAISIM